MFLMLNKGQFMLFVLYLFMSLAIGIALVWLGRSLVR
jgi:fluoride ion exporter CrcB/FEX